MPKCSFAFPGTYGHECGAPAVVVGLKKTTMTTDEIYYAFRCAECKDYKAGQDNSGIYAWEPVDLERHINKWNGTYVERVHV